MRGFVRPLGAAQLSLNGELSLYLDTRDVNASLFLSSDDTPRNKVRLLTSAGTSSGNHQVNRFPSGSPLVPDAAQKYYIEVDVTVQRMKCFSQHAEFM